MLLHLIHIYMIHLTELG